MKSRQITNTSSGSTGIIGFLTVSMRVDRRGAWASLKHWLMSTVHCIALQLTLLGCRVFLVVRPSGNECRKFWDQGMTVILVLPLEVKWLQNLKHAESCWKAFSTLEHHPKTTGTDRSAISHICFGFLDVKHTSQSWDLLSREYVTDRLWFAPTLCFRNHWIKCSYLEYWVLTLASSLIVMHLYWPVTARSVKEEESGRCRWCTWHRGWIWIANTFA